jgi:hypothetical protein
VGTSQRKDSVPSAISSAHAHTYNIGKSAIWYVDVVDHDIELLATGSLLDGRIGCSTDRQSECGPLIVCLGFGFASTYLRGCRRLCW